MNALALCLYAVHNRNECRVGKGLCILLSERSAWVPWHKPNVWLSANWNISGRQLCITTFFWGLSANILCTSIWMTFFETFGSGHMNPPGSPCVHDLQLIYQGVNTPEGPLQRLGRQFVMAGRQIARNFWSLVAIVAMAAGTMGFEDQRRGPGVKVRSKRRVWYRGDHLFEVTNQKHSAVGSYSAASFMG